MCAGQYIHVYTDTRMFIAQFLCQGWFQVYITQTCILGICDIETEGNSVVMCSCEHSQKIFLISDIIICSRVCTSLVTTQLLSQLMPLQYVPG
jgi:hypothetical protein